MKLNTNTSYWTDRGIIHTTDNVEAGDLVTTIEAYPEVDKRSRMLFDKNTGRCMSIHGSSWDVLEAF